MQSAIFSHSFISLYTGTNIPDEYLKLRRKISLIEYGCLKMYLLYPLCSRSLGSAFFYGACSVSLAFLNKAVISAYDFNYPFFIMAMQMIVSIIFLEILLKLGKIHLPTFTLKAARGFVLLSLIYGLHSVLSLVALRGMSIPVYTAVKRCTPLVNLVFTVLILHKPFPSYAIIVSVHIITLGCIIAVYRDLRFDPFTCFVGTLSVLVQGIYLTLIQKLSENKVSSLEILHFNAYLTLGPFTLVSFLMSEPQQIMKHGYLTDFSFILLFFTLALMGFVLNYSLFLCTSLNSALTTSLVGIGKASLQTFVGFFAFGGVKYDPWTMAGLLLNFIGGLIYTYVKYHESSLREKSTSNAQPKGVEHLNAIIVQDRS